MVFKLCHKLPCHGLNSRQPYTRLIPLDKHERVRGTERHWLDSVCVRATASCAGRQGDGRVNPSSISPMWGMQTVAVPMVTADPGCYSFKTFADKCQNAPLHLATRCKGTPAMSPLTRTTPSRYLAYTHTCISALWWIIHNNVCKNLNEQKASIFLILNYGRGNMWCMAESTSALIVYPLLLLTIWAVTFLHFLCWCSKSNI